MSLNIPPALLTAYVEQLEEDIRTAAGLVVAGKFDALCRLAHRISGTAPMYGLDAIGHCAQTMEKSSQKVDAAGARRSLAEMHKLVADLGRRVVQ